MSFFEFLGYRFPDYDKRAISVLNPSDVSLSFSFIVFHRADSSLLFQNLQTPDELEEEDRSAQAAVRHRHLSQSLSSLK